MRRGDPAPTAADLSSLADDVTQLGVNGRWRGRPDGCAAVAADETVLTNLRDDIRASLYPSP